MAHDENMQEMPDQKAPHHEHRAVFCHPASRLGIEIIATGPSGCGKSLVLEAVREMSPAISRAESFSRKRRRSTATGHEPRPLTPSP